VDWKGYGKEERSWEPEAHITKGAIKDFYKENVRTTQRTQIGLALRALS
jgi:hypothetical protein